uniref:Putative secreted peptide n=1 Tax=Anopheles braziliensis TaxID=58242 RepID=A0A2M3ZWR5_9DIPT
MPPQTPGKEQNGVCVCLYLCAFLLLLCDLRPLLCISLSVGRSLSSPAVKPRGPQKTKEISLSGTRALANINNRC